MIDFFDAAVFYTGLGWNVFPLRPGCKEPATRHGFKDASNDEDQLAAWAKRWPNANIAVRCGDESGMTVLDIDRHHGGHLTMERIVATGKRLPDTVTARSPQGGWHLYFAYNPLIGNTTDKLGKGLDTKSQGGYIVLPPSLWNGMKSGKQIADPGDYRWLRAPRGGDLPSVPDWMVQRLKPKPLPLRRP